MASLMVIPAAPEQVIDSKLTHREIRNLIGDKLTIKAISLIRRGYRCREELINFLNQADLSGTLKMIKLTDEVDDLIVRAKGVLDEDVYNVLITGSKENPLKETKLNLVYLKRYKEYIDLKVLYNKVIEVSMGAPGNPSSGANVPKNHGELIRLHQLIRVQHDEIKAMPGMRQRVHTG